MTCSNTVMCSKVASRAGESLDATAVRAVKSCSNTVMMCSNTDSRTDATAVRTVMTCSNTVMCSKVASRAGETLDATAVRTAQIPGDFWQFKFWITPHRALRVNSAPFMGRESANMGGGSQNINGKS